MNNPVRMPGYGASQTAQTDAGLRAHMLGVFRNMGIGLVITGLVAAFIGNTPVLAAAIFGTPLKWVAIFAPLAFVFFFSFRMEKMTTAGARVAASFVLPKDDLPVAGAGGRTGAGQHLPRLHRRVDRAGLLLGRGDVPGHGAVGLYHRA